MISVIIPVYNGEKYLERTLQSISAQTLSDFEVIMVDDGSTDSSPAIMKRIADSDSRFRIVQRRNGGLSAARNTGIKNARGEWIYFIDADDTARPDALERLHSIAVENDVPFVIGGYFEDVTEAWPDKFKTAKAVIMSASETLKIALYQHRRINSACGTLVNAKIFSEGTEPLRFTEGLYYEDLDIFPKICLRAGRIAYLSEPLYFYRQHPGSFIHTFSTNRLDSLIVTDSILELIQNTLPSLEPAARDRRMSAAFNVLLLLAKYKPTGSVPERYRRFGTTFDEISDYCMSIIRRQRTKALLDRNVRLKNKLGAFASFGGRPTLRLISTLASR